MCDASRALSLSCSLSLSLSLVFSLRKPLPLRVLMARHSAECKLSSQPCGRVRWASAKLDFLILSLRASRSIGGSCELQVGRRSLACRLVVLRPLARNRNHAGASFLARACSALAVCVCVRVCVRAPMVATALPPSACLLSAVSSALWRVFVRVCESARQSEDSLRRVSAQRVSCGSSSFVAPFCNGKRLLLATADKPSAPVNGQLGRRPRAGISRSPSSLLANGLQERVAALHDDGFLFY